MPALPALRERRNTALRAGRSRPRGERRSQAKSRRRAGTKPQPEVTRVVLKTGITKRYGKHTTVLSALLISDLRAVRSLCRLRSAPPRLRLPGAPRRSPGLLHGSSPSSPAARRGTAARGKRTRAPRTVPDRRPGSPAPAPPLGEAPPGRGAGAAVLPPPARAHLPRCCLRLLAGGAAAAPAPPAGRAHRDGAEARPFPRRKRRRGCPSAGGRSLTSGGGGRVEWRRGAAVRAAVSGARGGGGRRARGARAPGGEARRGEALPCPALPRWGRAARTRPPSRPPPGCGGPCGTGASGRDAPRQPAEGGTRRDASPCAPRAQPPPSPGEGSAVPRCSAVLFVVRVVWRRGERSWSSLRS